MTSFKRKDFTEVACDESIVTDRRIRKATCLLKSEETVDLPCKNC